MNEKTAIRTLDNVPVEVGMTLYLVDHVWSNENHESMLTPRAVTVLRISDGEKRSLLLRYQSGVETRWHPEAHDIGTRTLYKKWSLANDNARQRNLKKAVAIEREIESRRKELAAFKKRCGLK